MTQHIWKVKICPYGEYEEYLIWTETNKIEQALKEYRNSAPKKNRNDPVYIEYLGMLHNGITKRGILEEK